MKSRYVIPASIVLLIGADARAQETDTARLGTVVVSATKTPAERASLTQAVTVITGGELRARGITRVSDALRAVPGAALVQNGSIGSVNTLVLRGGESRYTKVLIDGVTVNAPGGFFDFSHLTTDNIERMEIVRGPASVVYGADAMTGIVQIFTRQGRGPISLNADARAGTYGTREATMDLSGASGRARYSVGGGTRRTDGVLKFNNQYYNGTLSGSAGFAPTDGSDVLVSMRYGAAEFHYPTDFTGAPVDSNSYRVQHRLTAGADANTRLAHNVTGRLRLGTNEVSDLTEDIGVPFGSTESRHSAFLSRNKRRSAELGFALLLPMSATLNVGAEYMHERERSVNEEGPVGGSAAPTSEFAASRDNRAAYAEVIGSFASRASYTLAVRRDDNSDYDAHNTYRVGTSVPVSRTTRARASFSTAFNAPAFNQLHPTLFTVGSPDLEPERNIAWEIGAEQVLAAGRLTVSAGYFSQRFRDLIQFVSGGPPDFLGSFDNLTEAESNGFDVEMRLAPVGNLSASAGYTQARPRVTRVSPSYQGDLEPGDPLIRRPIHSGNAVVTWSSGSVGSVSLSASYSGDRPDMDFTQFPSPVVTLPAYTRLDFSASREILRFAAGRSSLGLTLRVENALDRDYEDVLNFPAPGRTVLIGARYSGSL